MRSRLPAAADRRRGDPATCGVRRCAGDPGFLVGNPGHVSSESVSLHRRPTGGVGTNSSISNCALEMRLLVDGGGEPFPLRTTRTPFSFSVTGIGITKAAPFCANSVITGLHPASPTTPIRSHHDDDRPRQPPQARVGCRDGTRLPGANADTIDLTPELSGQVITAADCPAGCRRCHRGGRRFDVAQQCGFTAARSRAVPDVRRRHRPAPV